MALLGTPATLRIQENQQQIAIFHVEFSYLSIHRLFQAGKPWLYFYIIFSVEYADAVPLLTKLDFPPMFLFLW